MTEHDLKRVETLFQAAADLPPSDRSAYLDAECEDDGDLREHVDRLLARLDRDDSWTVPNRGHAGGPFPAAAIAEGPGAVIGRYKLLQVIGEGGFGVVYMAEQQTPVVRKVALKIIKLGMDTREVVARFEAERQALALMDHPNIARVLDGGATASGRPYFVMELVRGVAITEFCDRNDLAPRERLELFGEVCLAVQHAHQKGVIHRDLKPSNVMVSLEDGKAVPKIIDFGVAKAMHTRLTEKTLFTRFEQFIGTPAYMSPEQAEMSALDVDTRTDIYSLGVLLYELLTGTTPFDTQSLMRAGVAEIQRIIREEQPQRPSLRISTTGDADIARRRRLDAPALSRRLRGDLDWIVMKAMDKDRSRRYATAGAFADDIDRHLKSEPVTAGPPRTTYRVGKFIARNRAAVVSGSLLALALVAGIIGTTRGMVEADASAREAARSAALAQEQADHALSVLDFLVSTLSLTDPEIALDPELTVHALLGDTASRISDALANQPWAEARVRSTIGLAYLSLSEHELAEPQLRRAVELMSSLQADAGEGAGPPGFDAGDHYVTLWALTNVCFELERPDAFAVSQEARRIGLAHVGTSHPALADLLTRFVQAVEQGAWSLEPDAMGGVADLFDEASTLADSSLAADDPLWPIVADTFLSAGYLVWYTTHEHYAERFFERTLEIQQRVLPSDHPDTAATVGLLVNILNKMNRGNEAEALLRESIDALKRVHGESDYSIAQARSNLGEILVRQGRYDEAEPILLASHDAMLETLGNEAHFRAVESFVRLIILYDATDRPERAAPGRDALARASIRDDYTLQWSIARYAFGPEHARLVESGDRLNELCGAISFRVAPGTVVIPELAPLLDELLAARHDLLADDEHRAAAVARLLMGWANALDPVTHRAARQRMAAEAAVTLRAWSDRLPVDLAEALALAVQTDDVTDAPSVSTRRQLQEAWLLVRGDESRSIWFATAVRVRVARCLVRARAYEEAETLLLPALDRLVAQLGPMHDDVAVTRRLIADLYDAWGRPEDARKFDDSS